MLAHVVAINQIDVAFLITLQQQVQMRTKRLVIQEHGASRSDIPITLVQVWAVEGREVVLHGQYAGARCRQLYDALPIVAASGVGVERTIGDRDIDRSRISRG